MKNKIIFNSLIKNSRNSYLWLNILSATPEKKKVLRQEWDNFLKRQATIYIDTDDYIIEYKHVINNVNGVKTKNGFLYKSYLSDFGKKEQSFIRQLIKLRTAVVESATTVVADTIII